MTQPHRLTDRAALTRNRSRMRDAAMFLHREAADEINDRLQMVNRRFTAPAVISGFPALWQRLMPGAHGLADDEVLDLGPAAHDLIVHALALHWSNDPVGQLIQMRRGLKPDGMALAVLFGGETLHELRGILAAAESRETGGLSPRILPMGEIRDLGGLMQRAGFALPVADSVRLRASYADAWALMRELRAMGEANALEQRLKRPTRRALFETAAREYAARHVGPDGRIAATFEMLFLTGWAPHDDQQQPLRPGSAQSRLADALHVPETKLRS